MNQREAVERFHLVFLRHFAAVVSPGTICLKGGVNLRLYHNSPRLSELWNAFHNPDDVKLSVMESCG